MANTKNAKKAIKVSARRRDRNKAVRTSINNVFKKALTGITEGAKEATELVQAAATEIDKAVTKGVVHKNKAARKKSRLARRLNAAAAATKG